jgi:transglutaminase-like putative cysteine protease
LLWTIVLLNLFTVKQGLAEEGNKYNIINIPQELLHDVNAVVRNNSMTFTVEDIDEAYLKCTYAVTILNKSGEHFGQLRLNYDKFYKIKKLKGYIYDQQGKEIRELDDDDIEDHALISWATLYSDDRAKIAKLYHNEFPYTIEYEYEIELDGYISWPSWVPEEKDASVEYSSYNVIMPADSALRYQCYNMDIKPEITKINKKQVSYLWKVSNLPSFQIEPYGPSVTDQYKSVIIAPHWFKMDDYTGNLSSWNDFGKWSIGLWKPKQNLPEKAVNEIHSLIAGISDKKERIKILYKYMQSKTRYVNIYVGIGGWQPIDAEKVYERGYGDCKALTNYMITLLKYADIKAYPVLLYNNDVPNRFDTSFSIMSLHLSRLRQTRSGLNARAKQVPMAI